MPPINCMAQIVCSLLKDNDCEFKPVKEYAIRYAKYNMTFARFFRDNMSEEQKQDAIHIFGIRLLNRFLELFGLVEFKEGEYTSNKVQKSPDLVRTTPLFYKFIGINCPVTSEEYDFIRELIELQTTDSGNSNESQTTESFFNVKRELINPIEAAEILSMIYKNGINK
jgi:hypothetical protein